MIATLIILIISLSTSGCKDETPNPNSINRTWRVIKEQVSGELKTLAPPPDNSLYSDISITIPDLQIGKITGNTFRNNIGADFELSNDNQITFKNYGGSRISEDSWGAAFSENLLSTVRYEFSEKELHFIDSEDRTILVFIEK